jgi:hypothetical protein
VCHDALAVVPENVPRPYCAPPWGLDDWRSLLPGGSMVIFPTIRRPTPDNGVFLATLVPSHGHAPIVDWPSYSPDPVSFELTPAGCRPLDGTNPTPPPS